MVLTLVLLGGAQTAAPAGQQQIPNMVNQRPQNPFDDLGGMDPVTVERQLRALNAARQKSIVTDTARLLKLATGLKAEMGASNSDELTPAEMRELNEIEKLARNVRQEMSLTIGDGPAFRDPYALPVR